MIPLIKSGLYRMRHTQSFWVCVCSACGTGFLNVVILVAIQQFLPLFPAEILDNFYSGGYYNFGLVSIQSLDDLSNIGLSVVFMSSFRSSFLFVLIAFFSTFYLCGGFRNGYIPGGIVHRFDARSIWSSLLVNVGLAAILFELVFTVAVVIGSVAYWGVQIIDFSGFSSMFLLLGRQGLLLLSFTSVCVMICSAIRHSGRCLMVLLAVVLFLPATLKLVDLLFNTGRLFSNLWLVNISNQWAVLHQVPGLLSGFIVSLATLLLAGFFGVISIKKIDFV